MVDHKHSTKPGTITTLTNSPTLHVVTMISNPVRYNSRYELYRKFEKHIKSFSGVRLHTVEIAYGDRDFEITKSDNPDHIQLRTEHELWHKENAINVGISRLPADTKYIAWIDADIQFMNTDWVAETVHQLQHYDIVQLFRNAIDLGPAGQVMEIHTSFGYQLVNGTLGVLTTLPTPISEASVYYGSTPRGAYAHSGFAWAAKRDALNAIGNLPDFCIVGSADHHLALSLVGKANLSVPGNVLDSYSRAVMAVQDRCTKYIRQNVGYVDGTISHNFHGKKKDRRYVDRWKIITDNQFDPHTDIWKDSQGLHQLTPDKPKLRDDLRSYLRSRNEDSIEL